MQNPGPTLDLLNQNQPFINIPRNWCAQESLRITALKIISSEMIEIFSLYIFCLIFLLLYIVLHEFMNYFFCGK